jgi:hypothetical protein
MTIPNLSPLAPQKKSMMTGEDPHFPFWILTHMRLYIYILLLPIYIHWWLKYVKISKWLLIQPDFSAFSARTFQAVPCFPALAEVPMWFSTEITEQQTHGVDEQDQASTRKRDSKHQKMGIESFKLIEPSKKKSRNIYGPVRMAPKLKPWPWAQLVEPGFGKDSKSRLRLLMKHILMLDCCCHSSFLKQMCFF